MQNTLVILILGVICVIGYGNASIVGDIVEPGVVVTRYYSIMNRADADLDACTEVGVKCSTDCTSLVLCIASSGAGFRTGCAAINSHTPVCDKNINECAASLSMGGCAPPKDTYRCSMDGVFPDPAGDCKKYYMCNAGVVTIVECTETATFNAGIGACVKPEMLNTTDSDNSTTTTTRTCSEPLVCGTTNPSYDVYKPFPAYYMLCIGSESYMMKCEDDVNEYFDTELNKCVYSCKQAGSFPDTTNKQNYWFCAYEGAIGIKNACPPTYAFNVAFSQCVPKL